MQSNASSCDIIELDVDVNFENCCNYVFHIKFNESAHAGALAEKISSAKNDISKIL